MPPGPAPKGEPPHADAAAALVDHGEQIGTRAARARDAAAAAEGSTPAPAHHPARGTGGWTHHPAVRGARHGTLPLEQSAPGAAAIHALPGATRRPAEARRCAAEAEPAVHLRLRVEDARGAARVTLHAALHAAHELAPSLRRSRVHPAGSGSAWAHHVLHALHVAVGAHEGEPAASAGRGGLVVVLTVQHRSPPSLVAHPPSLFMFFYVFELLTKAVMSPPRSAHVTVACVRCVRVVFVPSALR